MYWLTLGCLLLANAALDVDNAGRFEFDDLPHAVAPYWNLDNLEYPAESVVVEPLGDRNRGLRVGRPDGSQAGRYTITLRASTHDWSPVVGKATHSASVRLAANYRGAAFFVVAVPGGGTLIDLGHGRLTVWQRVGEQDEKVDETDRVRQLVPGWKSDALHTYTVEWTCTGRPHDVPCRLLVDGTPILRFRGMNRPLEFDSTLEISFENGVGTGLIDFVEWRINDGRAKPAARFAVRRGERQLFLDSVGVERMTNLRRRVHQPERYAGNPVLRGEHPWEKSSVSVYGTMWYDPERRKFRLWYLCSPGPLESGRKWLEVGGYRRVANCTLLAYAESDDAVQWVKPELGQLRFEGSTRNNLIDIGIDNPEGVGVLHDPADRDPERRFKAFFWDRRLTPPSDPTGVDEALARIPVDPPGLTDARRAGGMWVAFSPDGIRWRTHGPVLEQGSDTTHTILYDSTQRQYLGFGRMGFGRTVALTTSDDGLHWTAPRQVLACDHLDGPGGQIYGMPIDRYEGLYVGMFWMYREGTDAKIDTQLAVSRDARRWTRVADRQTFIPNAPEGAWDDGMSRGGRAINVVGDKIYLHYSMVNGPHRSAKFPAPQRKYPGAIGLLTLRRDGFVSVELAEGNRNHASGDLLTRPFAWTGGALYVNADAQQGTLQARLETLDGKLVAESAPFRADSTRTRLIDSASVESLAVETPVRLRFTLADSARLYAYWTE